MHLRLLPYCCACGDVDLMTAIIHTKRGTAKACYLGDVLRHRELTEREIKAFHPADRNLTSSLWLLPFSFKTDRHTNKILKKGPKPLQQTQFW